VAGEWTDIGVGAARPRPLRPHRGRARPRQPRPTRVMPISG